jgi:hypothetical protein
MLKLKPHLSVQQIAKKHRLDVSFIQKQLDMGEPIEHEHTKDHTLAMDIALQHLDEIPDYYTRLKKMEASAKKEHKKFKDVKEALDDQRYCPLCDKRESKSECSYGQKAWEDFSVKDHEYSMARSELSTVMNAAKRLQKKMGKGEGNIEAWVQSKITKAADYLDAAADYVASGEMSEANALGFEIKKSSGVGALTPNAAKQLGDKAVVLQKKKAASVALPKLKEHKGIVAEILKDIQEEDPCWKGYTQVGMKDKGGRKVPNCVPSKGVPKAKGYKKEEVEIEEAVRLPATNGNIISVILSWRGRSYMTKMFFPQVKMPSRREVTDQIQKVYPGATILQYNLAGLEPGQPLIQVSDKSKNYLLNNKTIGEETEVSEVVYESGDYWHPDPKKDSAISGVGNKMRSREDRGQDTSAQTKPDYSNRLKPGETYMQFSKRKQAERTQKEEVAAWQRKEGKNQKGGLNEKGRKSYERENPGSDLKAPQPEGGSRRDSFCARMKGMKKKLTSAKTANDPDSRINKSLRAWNC